MFSRPPIPAVRARDVADGAYLIDVREDDEWLAGHAPDAVHLPMNELPERLAEVPAQGDVVIVCRSGHRSAEVTAYLVSRGFGHVLGNGGLERHHLGARLGRGREELHASCHHVDVAAALPFLLP